MSNENKRVNQKVRELKRKVMHERDEKIREIYQDSIKYLELKVS